LIGVYMYPCYGGEWGDVISTTVTVHYVAVSSRGISSWCKGGKSVSGSLDISITL
jgi:hypothetical protein